MKYNNEQRFLSQLRVNRACLASIYLTIIGIFADPNDVKMPVGLWLVLEFCDCGYEEIHELFPADVLLETEMFARGNVWERREWGRQTIDMDLPAAE